MVSVLTKGRVAVKVTEAVVASDKPYFHADGTFNKTVGEGDNKGLEIGIFASTQLSENNLAILSSAVTKKDTISRLRSQAMRSN
jgi:hypothetical protein